MTNQEIFDLVACFDRSTAQTMKLSTQEFTIELTRGGTAAPGVPAAAPAAVSAPAPAPQAAAGPSIDAPLVGTFYAAPAPDQAPFVKPGVTTGELDELLHDYTVNVQQCIPACLGYQPPGMTPYPATSCISINHVVCHGIPSDKKKLKVLKKLTRTDKKFADYIGAALTISKSVTDFVGMAYDVVMPKKETKKGKMTKKIMKRRMPYLRAYATAFKKRRMYNTILTDNFYKQNKKLIKKLIDEDLGFKKAFKILKSKKPHVAKTSKSSKGSVDIKAIEKQAMKQKSARKPVPKSMELTKFLDEVKGMDGVA